ncbi:hypothetical protein AB5I41_10455 [Sphingomonas sp. MMS24-JH45]
MAKVAAVRSSTWRPSIADRSGDLDPFHAPWHVEVDIDPDVRAGFENIDRLIDAGCLDGNETRPLDHVCDLDAEHTG